MNAKRHESDECPAAGATAAGFSPRQITQGSQFGRVPFGPFPRIGEFNHELER